MLDSINCARGANSADSKTQEKTPCLVACDVGLKRIGLATYQQGIVLPLEPILRINRNQAALTLDTLLQERGATHLIIGLPSGGIAGYEEMQKRIKHFASLLNFSGKIVYVNEDYSSKEARELLTHSRARKDKSGHLDSISACVILERFVDSVSSFISPIM